MLFVVSWETGFRPQPVNLPIEEGEKYALIALDCAHNIDEPLQLSGGLVALPRGALVLPAHWKDWLGTIRTKSLERADLVVVAKSKSKSPEVLDDENERLCRATEYLLWGLLATDALRMDGEPEQLTGASLSTGIDVRKVGKLRPILSVPGPRRERLGSTHLIRAAELGTNLSLIAQRPGYRFLLSATRTFMTAFSEDDIGDRIHQFVRAIDGITRVRHRNQFRDRSALLVGPTHVELCWEMYVVRSNVEHFKDPSTDLPPLGQREDRVRAFRLANAAEAIARHCLARLVGRKDLWPQFSDEGVETFWQQEPVARAGMWGDTFDLNALVIDERRIP